MANKQQKTIKEVLNNLATDAYIKYLRIDMLETVDDTSHFIIYKKNRNNAGTLTVLDKTMPFDTRFTSEYTIINGYSIAIRNPDKFHKFVINYLKEYSSHYGFCGGTDYSVLFTVRIKFSNGDIIHIVVNTSINRKLTMKFYEELSKYSERIEA